MSARSPVAQAAALLAEAGVASPRVDAELLAAHVLGARRGLLATADWPEPARRNYAELVAHRARRVPLQYLIGVAGFRRLTLAVGPGVFVPRPETESLVHFCLRVLGNAAATVVDLGAGSGAIALSLATEAPACRVFAVEADPDAYGWLERNAAGSSVRLCRGDLAVEPAGLDGQVDLVVANPPYLPDWLRGLLEPEVGRYEPPAALWGGGPDGLDVLRAVLVRAARLLRPGGWVAIEHADDQGPGALAALSAAGWQQPADHRDLSGRPRFATGRWAG